MDKYDQRKITRNLVVVKERVEGDLDFIVDRLIEKDIFTIQIKEDIDNAQPPTPQKKTTLFINKLLRSGKQSYSVFKDILQERGCEDIIKLMEETRPDTASSEGASGWTEDRGKTFVIPSLVDETDGTSNAKSTLAPGEMERMLTIVMSKFEEKESQIKAELREEFEKKLETDRKDHEDTIKLLKEDLSKLAKISEEYEHLKNLQKSLRKQLDDQHTKVKALNQENIQLKREVTKLDTLTEENAKLKSENETLKRENTRMTNEIKTLEAHITDKETEINDLKVHIEMQYQRLKSDLSKTRDRFENEQGNLHADMQKQQNMLSDISKAVHAITMTMTVEPEETPNRNQARTPRSKGRPWVTGKTNPKSTYNKLLGYQTPKRK